MEHGSHDSLPLVLRPSSLVGQIGFCLTAVAFGMVALLMIIVGPVGPRLFGFVLVFAACAAVVRSIRYTPTVVDADGITGLLIRPPQTTSRFFAARLRGRTAAEHVPWGLVE